MFNNIYNNADIMSHDRDISIIIYQINFFLKEKVRNTSVKLSKLKQITKT